MSRLLGVFVASLFLRAAGIGQGKPTAVSAADSAAIVARVIAAEQRFLADWKKMSLEMHTRRSRIGDWTPATRQGVSPPDLMNVAVVNFYTFCLKRLPAHRFARPVATIIPSTGSIRSYCPSWPLYVGKLDPDMSRALDSALTNEQRVAVFATRNVLISQIDSAVSILPGDNWLAGQLVRFNLDQAFDSASYFGHALTAAQRCRAQRWWCTALAGLVFSSSGAVGSADSAFEAVARDLGGPARCAWLDVSALLDPEGRTAYAAAPCAEREAIATRLWWLAEPLWSAQSHERRVEHYSRKIHLALRSSLPRDERFNWRPEEGGDAAREMVLRYGWPSYMTWTSTAFDDVIDDYVVQAGSASSRPYTSSEYSWGRIHVVPPWSVLSDALALQPMSWYLNLPDSLRVPPVPIKNGAIDQTREYRESYARALSWWPVEHYARPRPLVQLADGQVAFLRRDSSVVTAVAANLATSNGSGFSTGISVALVRSPDPTTIQTIGRSETAVGEKVVVSGEVPSSPALLSLEVRGAGGGAADARFRLGVTPPSVLRSLVQGGYAISDPILVRASASDVSLPMTPTSAIQSMLGSTRIRGDRTVSLYWETYGVPAGDSVTFSIRMERQARPGVAQRVAVALRILGNQRASTDVTWSEPDGSHNSAPIVGIVPIQARSVTLDLSGLTAGTYWVGISATKRGSPPVVGSRTIVLE